jgi:hypothetical protein
MEELPAPVLPSIYLQVDDERFGAEKIRELYGSDAYPLARPSDPTPGT